MHSVQFSSVAQSCPTLCDPVNCSRPGLPVHHQLPEFTKTHVHRVGDAIQPSHLLSPSPPAPNPSQHRGLFHVLCIESWIFWECSDIRLNVYSYHGEMSKGTSKKEIYIKFLNNSCSIYGISKVYKLLSLFHHCEKIYTDPEVKFFSRFPHFYLILISYGKLT